jgi:hypothetical protein
MHGVNRFGGKLKEIIYVVKTFSISYIFLELNEQADALSKEGTSFPLGKVSLVEYREGETQELWENLWT